VREAASSTVRIQAALAGPEIPMRNELPDLVVLFLGKEIGYLLYDEVNELLPSEITSSDELDDLFNAFGSAGIQVVDSEKAYLQEKPFDRTGEGAEELELDLTPGALDKTKDPVRMYLREMGSPARHSRVYNMRQPGSG
jgi:hypothetical protein